MAAVETNSLSNRMIEVRKFDESKIGVKGLSDSGVTSIPHIFIQPPETLSDLKSSLNSTVDPAGIPVIDISGVDSDTLRPKIIEEIKEAAKTWGFFQIVNHGIPVTTINETIEAIKAFHDQPTEIKSKHYKRKESGGVSYSSNNDLYRSKAATWHDFIQAWMGPEPPQPEEIPKICREEIIEWEKHTKNVAETLLELLSEGLGLKKGKLKELTFSDARLFAGMCYPYCPQPDLTVGIKSHTDLGVITVLAQNHVPGLQVKHGEEWVSVKPVPDSLIINVADLLQIVSNGQYKSVEHRVLANSYKEERISIVVFFNVVKWMGSGYYGPLPELVSPEKPAIYRNFTKEEYYENFYSKGIDSKSMIEKIKISN